MRGQALLNIAAQQGDLETTRVLIEAGADVDGADERPLDSALFGLHLRDVGIEGEGSLRSKHIEVVRELLEAGADYDFYIMELPFLAGFILDVCSDIRFDGSEMKVIEQLPSLNIQRTAESEQAFQHLSALAEFLEIGGPCANGVLQRIELK
jgi:hypothetical protein